METFAAKLRVRRENIERHKKRLAAGNSRFPAWLEKRLKKANGVPVDELHVEFKPGMAGERWWFLARIRVIEPVAGVIDWKRRRRVPSDVHVVRVPYITKLDEERVTRVSLDTNEK